MLAGAGGCAGAGGAAVAGTDAEVRDSLRSSAAGDMDRLLASVSDSDTRCIVGGGEMSRC